MPMPSNSTGTVESCGFCASGWGGSSATSGAKSQATSRSRKPSPGRYLAPIRSAPSGKASAPYEFGVKASVVTTNARAPGGQFVLHARALPGNPYDGHTLRGIIEDTEWLTGRQIERVYVDKGYR